MELTSDPMITVGVAALVSLFTVGTFVSVVQTMKRPEEVRAEIANMNQFNVMRSITGVMAGFVFAALIVVTWREPGEILWLVAIGLVVSLFVVASHCTDRLLVRLKTETWIPARVAVLLLDMTLRLAVVMVVLTNITI